MLDKRIDWTATPQAQAAVTALGRTEDVHWSPDGRHIAIAAFARNEVLVLAVEYQDGVHLSAARWIACAQFASPHGVYWMDDDRLIVANRLGGVTIVAVPQAAPEYERIIVTPLSTIASGQWQVKTPGSVCAVRLGNGLHELLVCNNYANRVSSHLVDARDELAIHGGSVLLEAGLGVPDGVAISPDRAWIAISNHDHHSVFVYRNGLDLHPDAEPDAVLEGLAYPHGLRFTPDGNALLVADAGRPEVHWFRRSGADWHGQRIADKVLRVLNEAAFRAGQYNPQEGGPKGIALSPDGTVLAMTCEQRTLDFFDATTLQAGTDSAVPAVTDAELLGSLLLRQLPPASRAADRLQAIERSRIWRWTHRLYGLEETTRNWWRGVRQMRRRATTALRTRISAKSGQTPS
ncbi:MAG: hypothetical protein LPJ91_02435 [Pseudazoarcus pumilus]|nr:hypothetical protein [Pseudazoarcus pumilus]